MSLKSKISVFICFSLILASCTTVNPDPSKVTPSKVTPSNVTPSKASLTDEQKGILLQIKTVSEALNTKLISDIKFVDDFLKDPVQNLIENGASSLGKLPDEQKKILNAHLTIVGNGIKQVHKDGTGFEIQKYNKSNCTACEIGLTAAFVVLAIGGVILVTYAAVALEVYYVVITAETADAIISGAAGGAVSFSADAVYDIAQYICKRIKNTC